MSHAAEFDLIDLAHLRGLGSLKWSAVLAYLDTNRLLLADLIAQHLPAVRYAPPQGTYIVWLDCRDLALDMPPAEFFRTRAGVALTDGADCGEAGEGFVRMVIATPAPILEQAVTRMGQAVATASVGSPPR